MSARRRLAAGAALAVAVVSLTGCLPAGPESSPGTTTADPVPQERPPAAVGEAHESEVPAGWDEPGEAVVVPVGELDAEARRGLLRLEASSDPVAGACTAGQLSASLRYTDAALGHRYGYITVSNEHPDPCVLRGYPGFGARGASGSTFVNEVEQSPMASAGEFLPEGYTPETVILAGTEVARVQLEWTGALGGAGAEPLQDMLLQPFHGTDPVPVADAAEEAFDVSMFTTVRIRPFLPAEARH